MSESRVLCEGKLQDGRRCTYKGYIKVNGKFYCKRHADQTEDNTIDVKKCQGILMNSGNPCTRTATLQYADAWFCGHHATQGSAYLEKIKKAKEKKDPNSQYNINRNKRLCKCLLPIMKDNADSDIIYDLACNIAVCFSDKMEACTLLNKCIPGDWSPYLTDIYNQIKNGSLGKNKKDLDIKSVRDIAHYLIALEDDISDPIDIHVKISDLYEKDCRETLLHACEIAKLDKEIETLQEKDTDMDAYFEECLLDLKSGLSTALATKLDGNPSILGTGRYYGITNLMSLVRKADPTRYNEVIRDFNNPVSDTFKEQLKKVKFGDICMHTYIELLNGKQFEIQDLPEILTNMRRAIAITTTGGDIVYNMANTSIEGRSELQLQATRPDIWKKNRNEKFMIEDKKYTIAELVDEYKGLIAYKGCLYYPKIIDNPLILNTFKGYKAKEMDEEVYTLHSNYVKIIRNNILLNLCGGETNAQEFADYVENWLSFLVQKPDKHRVMLIFANENKLTGKSAFLSFITQKIIGKANSHTAGTLSDILDDKFNSMLVNRRLMCFNEVAGDVKAIDKLKSMLSDKDTHSRAMHQEAKTVASYRLFIGASNYTAPKLVADDTTRFCFIKGGDKNHNDVDLDYLLEAYNDDNAADAFYTYLLKKDISHWDANTIPKGACLEEAREINKNSVIQFLEDIDPTLDKWNISVSAWTKSAKGEWKMESSLIRKLYTDFCNSIQVKPDAPNIFGKKAKEIIKYDNRSAYKWIKNLSPVSK